MQVKKFKFINFGEWYNNGREYKEQIGDFTCEIGCVGHTIKNNIPKEITYRIAISKDSYPLNIYTHKLFMDTINWDMNDEKVLKDWYEKVIIQANKEWQKYILNNYLD